MKSIHLDILRAIEYYQETHDGQGMPDDNDLLIEYIKKVKEIDWWSKETK